MNVFPLVVLVVLLFKMGHDFHMGILVKDGHIIWYYRELCYCHVNIHLLKFMIGFTLFVMSLTCHVRANPFFIIFCFVNIRIIFAKCLCSFFVLLWCKYWYCGVIIHIFCYLLIYLFMEFTENNKKRSLLRDQLVVSSRIFGTSWFVLVFIFLTCMFRFNLFTP